MIRKIAIALLVLVAGILGFAASKPDTFQVERAIRIDAPPERVFEFIDDFRRWESWSPWDQIDPGMMRRYGGADRGVGAEYAWASENRDAGRGSMRITDSESPSRIGIALEFTAPFAASDTVEFTLAPNGNGTDVTWSMQGAMPFAFKVMSVFMSVDAMVGKDFETGLASLKAVAERQ